MSVPRWLRRHVTLLSAYGLCLLLFAVATGYSRGFASAANLRQIFVFSAFVGFAALGQTIVVLAGGLDLSVPWLMAFGGIQLSHWAGAGGLPDWLIIVLVVLIGAAVGLANGIGVTLLGVSPIIMTLGVGGLIQAYLLSIGLLQSTGNQVPSSAVRLATGRVGGVPVIALVWLGLALAAGFRARADSLRPPRLRGRGQRGRRSSLGRRRHVRGLGHRAEERGQLRRHRIAEQRQLRGNERDRHAGDCAEADHGQLHGEQQGVRRRQLGRRREPFAERHDRGRLASA